MNKIGKYFLNIFTQYIFETDAGDLFNGIIPQDNIHLLVNGYKSVCNTIKNSGQPVVVCLQLTVAVGQRFAYSSRLRNINNGSYHCIRCLGPV